MGRPGISALVALLLLRGAALSAQSGRPLTARDVVSLRTPISVALAPDGAAVLFERVDPDPSSNRLAVSVWRVGWAGGEPERVVQGGTLPRWAPAGDSIAFLAVEGGRGRLWIAAADGAGRREVPDAGAAPLDFAWSPDGRRIAFVAPVDTLPQVHVVDLRTGAVRRLTAVDFRIIVHPWEPGSNLRWSPDGTRLAFSGKPTARFDDDYRSDVWLVDAESGALTRVTRRDGMDMRPVWSPDGRTLVFRTSAGRVDRFANHGLALLDVATGRIRDPGDAMQYGFLDGPYAYEWTPDGRSVVFTAAAPETVGIFALDVATGVVTRLDGGTGVHGALSLAARADRMAFVRADPTSPWEVWVSALAPYAPQRRTASNPGLEGRALARAEVVTWESAGRRLRGVVYIPADLDPARPAPVITVVHGGPEGQALAGFWAELPSPRFTLDGTLQPPHLFAAHGFVVFAPNFRGSGGHGMDLRRAGSVDWSRAFLEDIESGLDALVARGLADSTRLYLIGSRSGATKVVSLLTNSTRFRAAFAHAPYPDLVAEYRDDEDFRLMHDGLMGGSPDARPEAWARHSPIEHVGRIRTPLLIATEEDAFSIPSSQALRLHRRLLEGRVPGQLILYRGRTLADSIELLDRILAWFGAPQPRPTG